MPSERPTFTTKPLGGFRFRSRSTGTWRLRREAVAGRGTVLRNRLHHRQRGPGVCRRWRIGRAEAVEGSCENLRDRLRLTPLDVAAVHQGHRLPILKECDRRRGWRIVGKDRPQVRNRSFVTARENGRRLCRAYPVLKGQSDRGTRLTCRASANRIHHHENCAAAWRQYSIHIRRRPGLFQSVSGQVRAHRRNKLFRVWHALIVTAGVGGRDAHGI